VKRYPAGLVVLGLAMAGCGRSNAPERPPAPAGLAECRRAASATDDLMRAVLEVDEDTLENFMPRFRALLPLAEACAPYANRTNAPRVVKACAAVQNVGTEVIDWMVRAATWSGPDDGTLEAMLAHAELDLLPQYDEAAADCFR
jgi:hypothetical protein